MQTAWRLLARPATQPEEVLNASPGISIDNSQSPTTVVLFTASTMPPGSDQSPRSDSQEDDLTASASQTRERYFTPFAMYYLHQTFDGSQP